MKTISLDPSTVITNPLIAARKGDPDPAKVQRLATNMLERREAGRPHQMYPGIVRLIDDGKYELIAGRHRLEAEKLLNSMVEKDAKDEDRYQFDAVVVRADNEQAMLDAIDENEFRVASSIFDKAHYISQLVESGKTQAEVAKRLQISEGHVSRLLKAKDCPKKYRKMYEDGDITEDALLLFLSLPVKDEERNEILDLAVNYRKAEDEIADRIASRQNGEDEEEEDEGEDENEEVSESTGKPKKKMPGAKAKPAAKKKAPAKGKVTKADVKEAAKAKGVGKDGPTPITRTRFLTMLQALDEDKENPLPESARMLMSRIWMVLDGEASIVQLRNSFIKHCVPDSKGAANKGKAA